jgi:hypothetical protein
VADNGSHIKLTNALSIDGDLSIAEMTELQGTV